MRTYDQLVTAIIVAVPTKEEIDSLTAKQIEDLRRFGNCYDNMLYLSTRAGRELSAELRAKREAGQS